MIAISRPRNPWQQSSSPKRDQVATACALGCENTKMCPLAIFAVLTDSSQNPDADLIAPCHPPALWKYGICRIRHRPTAQDRPLDHVQAQYSVNLRVRLCDFCIGG